MSLQTHHYSGPWPVFGSLLTADQSEHATRGKTVCAYRGSRIPGYFYHTLIQVKLGKTRYHRDY